MTWKDAKGPSEPRPFRELLGTFTTRLGLAPPDALATVFAGWPKLAGDVLAGHVTPIGLRNGVLYLEADEVGWASQLRFLGDDLCRRINEETGRDLVHELSVRVRTDPARRRNRGQ